MSAARPLPPRLVAATHNAGKLKELRELLEPQRVEVVSAAELDLPEPEETGTTSCPSGPTGERSCGGKGKR